MYVPDRLKLSLRSLLVISCIIHLGWLELPLARTIFHGPKLVRAIEVLMYFKILYPFEKQQKSRSFGFMKIFQLTWIQLLMKLILDLFFVQCFMTPLNKIQSCQYFLSSRVEPVLCNR